VNGEAIGERIARLRRERKLSQRELAEQALDLGGVTNRRGVSYAYVSRIEAGQRVPSTRALRLLAPILGVTSHYLEFGFELECPHCGEVVAYEVSGRPFVPAQPWS
jgi:transcriptional regulator with XRE-family HTH domain